MDHMYNETDITTHQADLPDLDQIDAEVLPNGAVAAALARIQSRTKPLITSHYTKHTSHATKHSSNW